MTEIWHNPRCSKSRETLALVEEKGPVTIRKYLEDAPTEAEIRAVLGMLGIKAIDLIRKGEAAFKDHGLSKDSSEDELIAAMVAVPKLIERPVVIAGGQARLGRPPVSVLDIL
ncbi:arsenate reductase (glutaredoxin) [Cognatishimia sp. WU-CL00825]|uniref:arsenate reductase (glutaredoxin) n=1 Tax=Cognatishimia sp. WU-CL00825 TaxID=3127658 RepID=UPI0031098F71